MVSLFGRQSIYTFSPLGDATILTHPGCHAHAMGAHMACVPLLKFSERQPTGSLFRGGRGTKGTGLADQHYKNSGISRQGVQSHPQTRSSSHSPAGSATSPPILSPTPARAQSTYTRIQPANKIIINYLALLPNTTPSLY
jgi:hypothetical protein